LNFLLITEGFIFNRLNKKLLIFRLWRARFSHNSIIWDSITEKQNKMLYMLFCRSADITNNWIWIAYMFGCINKEYIKSFVAIVLLCYSLLQLVGEVFIVEIFHFLHTVFLYSLNNLLYSTDPYYLFYNYSYYYDYFLFLTTSCKKLLFHHNNNNVTIS